MALRSASTAEDNGIKAGPIDSLFEPGLSRQLVIGSRPSIGTSDAPFT
jgi:hypothetical protein